MPTPVLELFDQIYIINLPHRSDRRAEMTEQLARIGLSFDHAQVTLFEAVRPNDQGDFPSIGARGCFLSHLGVLKDAHQNGYKRILILEDDADFTFGFISADEDLVKSLDQQEWAFLYFGYEMDAGHSVDGEKPFGSVGSTVRLGLTHGMAIERSTIDKIIPYFEAMLSRPSGDPNGGPMHVDGAYSWFRKDHQELETIASRDQLVVQRASKTDIHETSWIENVPFINTIRRAKNKLTRHH